MIEEKEKLERERQQLLQKLSDPEFLSNSSSSNQSAKFRKISQKLKEIEKKLFLYREIFRKEKKIQEAKSILSEASDPELIELAEKEIAENEEIKKQLLQKLKNKKEENKSIKSIIMEIRAGAGGEEAALFAADLFRMYQLYAAKNNWPLKIIDQNRTSLNGLKEIIFEIDHPQAYQNLRYEAGVHRVQRIPATEKSGRIHTSTASVAVLPQVENPHIIIKPEDLEISFFRSSGPGGQNVQKVETAVRIKHKPTGIVVSCQSERSQRQNREKALEILKNKLWELEQEKIQGNITQKRREQIGRADRAEKIRTYNFPQDRITDHRIKTSWHNIQDVLDGHLEEIIETLKKEYPDS
ncbi:peptide chain release factor 1 [bacterium]|nr:peptide chain release factor 1 [bacterium]